MARCRHIARFCLLLLACSLSAQRPPADISGQYSFLHQGEYVQVAVQGEQVTGFVSRLGETEFDRGVVLDHKIINGTLRGARMSFATTEIHAMWFEFDGRVERGPGKSRAEEGYFVLNGTLKRHSSDAEHRERVESREVSFRSEPE